MKWVVPQDCHYPTACFFRFCFESLFAMYCLTEHNGIERTEQATGQCPDGFLFFLFTELAFHLHPSDNNKSEN